MLMFSVQHWWLESTSRPLHTTWLVAITSDLRTACSLQLPTDSRAWSSLRAQWEHQFRLYPLWTTICTNWGWFPAVNRVSVIVSAHSALFPSPLDRFTPYRCVPLQPHQHVLIQHKVYLNLPRSSGSARITHTHTLNPYHHQYPYVSPLMFPKSHKSHDIIGIALLHPYHLPHIAYTRYRPRSIYINSIIVLPTVLPRQSSKAWLDRSLQLWGSTKLRTRNESTKQKQKK